MSGSNWCRHHIVVALSSFQIQSRLHLTTEYNTDLTRRVDLQHACTPGIRMVSGTLYEPGTAAEGRTRRRRRAEHPKHNPQMSE